jgi:hypothetical protein
LISSLCLSWPAAARDTPTFTYLYNFSIANYANGVYPQGNLAIDRNGVLYGTTELGGAYNQCFASSDEGCGTVFALTPPASPSGPWTETVLWSFGATSADSYSPFGVTMGRGGVLYGVASGGGDCGGTIFSLTPPGSRGGTWAEAVIYRFTCAPDGTGPDSGLAIDANGAIYGTTQLGGTSTACSEGCGTVFSLAPPSSPGGDWTETVLWSFGGAGGGFSPRAGVVLGAGGVLYGVTQAGGTGGDGIAFALTPPEGAGGAWAETVLYSFPASATTSTPKRWPWGRAAVRHDIPGRAPLSGRLGVLALAALVPWRPMDRVNHHDLPSPRPGRPYQRQAPWPDDL